MKYYSWIVPALICGIMTANASEYFVSKQGNDANSGQSRDKAFLTIQKGLNSIKPGDALTIASGEYFESVALTNFGSFDKETLIRAEIPGTVLLRGDVNAPSFTKVEGRRFVYVADFDRKVLSVHEVDTMMRLLGASDIDALEFRPGSWYQDTEGKKLYISSSDFQAPDFHRYTVGLLRGSGFKLADSRRVIIDGLAASGFMTPAKDPVLWLPEGGFLLHHATRSNVRRCSSFLNANGIGIRNEPTNGAGTLVEECRAGGNPGDGIVAFWPSSDTFSNSCSFLNGGCGIQFYADRTGNVLFSRCLSWGNGYGDFRMKGGGLSGEAKFAMAEQCI
ncbi:MAG: right-handed parallel beta-helix repeat-containing protein, partial [Kiritimatiellia bacterium]